MADFLDSLGLGFIREKENTIRGFLGHVLTNGKGIVGYYGLPYINEHFGRTQIVARVFRNNEGNLSFAGFDTHIDTLCIWKLRVQGKMNDYDPEDPTRVMLLANGMDGKGLLHINVINGDILPSFKEDEVIELQMAAFTDNVEIYDDEDAYAATVKPDAQGRKTMIGINTIFPVGFFSDNKEVKDIVQIHGAITTVGYGDTKIGEGTILNVRYHVQTQFGEIWIPAPFDENEYRKGTYKSHIGKILNCYARLCGDAAIEAHENGIVKDAENNLKLVAYSLEKGDPERMRSVLADHFVYHSENSGRHYENADEFIAFTKMVHENNNMCHTQYATIQSIDEGETELEYPVGTRCAVISYENEKGINSIIFVDTDEDGNISRILLSKEGRYRFRVDPPLSEPEDIFAELAKQTFEEAAINRAHFFSLVPRKFSPDNAIKYLKAHEAELAAAVADIPTEGLKENAFAEAFLRGIRLNGAENYDEAEMIRIGKQFVRDFSLHTPEEERTGRLNYALQYTAAIGCNYRDKSDDENEDDESAASPADERQNKAAGQAENPKLRIAKMIAEAYTTGDFEPLFPLMTDNYEHHSYWVWEPMVGKETVIPYYRGKGNSLKKSDRKIKTKLVRIMQPQPKEVEELYLNGEKMKPGSRLTVWSDIGSICVLMMQTLENGKESTVLAMPTINEEGRLTQLLITEPNLFTFEELKE